MISTPTTNGGTFTSSVSSYEEMMLKKKNNSKTDNGNGLFENDPKTNRNGSTSSYNESTAVESSFNSRRPSKNNLSKQLTIYSDKNSLSSFLSENVIR